MRILIVVELGRSMALLSTHFSLLGARCFYITIIIQALGKNSFLGTKNENQQ